MDNLKQTRVLPFWGNGEDAGTSEVKAAPDQRGFTDILKIFVRTWPYLIPQIVGYWREIPRRTAADLDGQTNSAKNPTPTNHASVDEAWSFRHVPPFVTLLTALGAFFWLAPPGTDRLHDFLLAATVFMTLLVWMLLFVKGRVYLLVSLALGLVGTIAFLFAVFAVDGLADNLHVGLVSMGCVCIWVLQYRFAEGKLQLRVRLGSHLGYYFLLLWASTLLTMVIALFSVDLISQSILQAKPLTPFLADFISQPELAGETGANPDSSETAVSGS